MELMRVVWFVQMAEISRVLAPGGVFVASTFLKAAAPLGELTDWRLEVVRLGRALSCKHLLQTCPLTELWSCPLQVRSLGMNLCDP